MKTELGLMCDSGRAALLRQISAGGRHQPSVKPNVKRARQIDSDDDEEDEADRRSEGSVLESLAAPPAALPSFAGGAVGSGAAFHGQLWGASARAGLEHWCFEGSPRHEQLREPFDDT